MMIQTVRPFSLRSASLFTTAILLTLLLAAAAPGKDSLKGALGTPIGLGPSAIATGDFNGDGKLDCASSNTQGQAVGVLFGDGHGGLTFANSYLLGTNPTRILAGQFSNDSFLDLVVLNPSATNISLLTNNGSGGFTITTYSTAFTATSIATADFNNDGRADLALGGGSNNLVGVMLANPGGGFNAPSLIEIPTANISSISAGLINADGNYDLITTNYFLSSVSVLTGNGAGGFSAPVTTNLVGVNTQPNAVALGDFTGDGNLDALVYMSRTKQLGVLAGNGAGGFATPVNTDLNAIGQVTAVVVKDVNNDSKPDILLPNLFHTLLIMYGNGTGGVMMQKSFMLTQNPRAVAVADFNGDGLVDLPAVSETTGVVTMLLNQGGGDFLTPSLVTSDRGLPYFADFNGDGKQDLLLDSDQFAAEGFVLATATVLFSHRFSSRIPLTIRACSSAT